VTIRTGDPNAFYKTLNSVILNERIKVTSVTCPDDNLQSVFNYLVK